MTVQERTIVNETDEEVKEKKRKILGIFPRRSGSTTPVGVSGGDLPRGGDEHSDDDLPPREVDPPRVGEGDEDDLPPREDLDDESGGGDIGVRDREDRDDPEEEAVATIPKTAGFDFSAISKELGKEIDVENLEEPRAEPVVLEPLEPLERSGSAPPAAKLDRSSPMVRSTSYMYSEEDTAGDITSVDMPSWDEPVVSAVTNSAWDIPLRAAPPARPHPPELTGNDPLAFGDPWKKDENPW